MKIRLFRALAIAFICCPILFASLDSVFAATVKSNNGDFSKAILGGMLLLGGSF